MAQVMLFAGNFAPLNWAYCNGQLQAIADNPALFALLGTTYGGDGQQTFALPDLRGRTPLGVGQGSGLSSIALGQVGGAVAVTLTQGQLATHTHVASLKAGVSGANGTLPLPVNNIPANTQTAVYAAASGANGLMGGVTGSMSMVGGTTPVDLTQPYLAMNFVICTQGIFPSRN